MSDSNNYFSRILFDLQATSSWAKKEMLAGRAVEFLNNENENINPEKLDLNSVSRAVLSSMSSNLLRSCKKALIDISPSSISFSGMEHMTSSYISIIDSNFMDLIIDDDFESLSNSFKHLFYEFGANPSNDNFNPLDKLAPKFIEFQTRSMWGLIETFYYSGYDPTKLALMLNEDEYLKHDESGIKSQQWLTEYQSANISHNIKSSRSQIKKSTRKHVL